MLYCTGKPGCEFSTKSLPLCEKLSVGQHADKLALFITVLERVILLAFIQVFISLQSDSGFKISKTQTLLTLILLGEMLYVILLFPSV
jgi:hypothetical protein